MAPQLISVFSSSLPCLFFPLSAELSIFSIQDEFEKSIRIETEMVSNVCLLLASSAPSSGVKYRQSKVHLAAWSLLLDFLQSTICISPFFIIIFIIVIVVVAVVVVVVAATAAAASWGFSVAAEPWPSNKPSTSKREANTHTHTHTHWYTHTQ